MSFVTKLWLSSKSAIASSSSNAQEKMRAIAYSMDLLIPGLYIWLPRGFTLRIGGSLPDDEPYKYPGMIHSSAGFGLVLPGYKILTTYQGSYDPKQTPDIGFTKL
ncbi:hypothetical protein WKK05_17630 [Nostoc sp. UHCC 0302]|uniref:hypothetical protein n=1 Tax=Nostoc sp. UHCC 0302 TaxID=3134896 RepID=UPI00311C9557